MLAVYSDEFKKTYFRMILEKMEAGQIVNIAQKQQFVRIISRISSDRQALLHLFVSCEDFGAMEWLGRILLPKN